MLFAVMLVLASALGPVYAGPPAQVPAGISLYSVWGASASDVFASGEGGTILHYDGKAWAPMSSGVTGAVYVSWGSSGKDVFATVEDSSTLLHYDGSAWSAMNIGSNFTIGSVYGSSATDVFAVGLVGTILHYDG
jgi:hypothetical protein